MAGKQSWAEKRWWRGTVFDWMGVLLLLLLIFVVAFVSVPFLLLRHTVSSGLQDYYLTVYRSTCASWERRTAALPYVLQSNGVRRLASTGDVVVLPPAPSGGLRLTLSKAAIAGGAKGLQFVRVSAWRTDPACAELSRQIQANAARQQARHPLVDVGSGSGHPCCDRARLRAPPPRGQENASRANAARLGTAQRGAIQSAEAR